MVFQIFTVFPPLDQAEDVLVFDIAEDVIAQTTLLFYVGSIMERSVCITSFCFSGRAFTVILRMIMRVLLSVKQNSHASVIRNFSARSAAENKTVYYYQFTLHARRGHFIPNKPNLLIFNMNIIGKAMDKEGMDWRKKMVTYDHWSYVTIFLVSLIWCRWSSVRE